MTDRAASERNEAGIPMLEKTEQEVEEAQKLEEDTAAQEEQEAFQRMFLGYTRTVYAGVRIYVPEGWVIKERITAMLWSAHPEYKMVFCIIGPKFEGYMAVPVVGALINLVSGKAWTFALPMQKYVLPEDKPLTVSPYDVKPVNFWLMANLYGFAFFGDGLEPPNPFFGWWARNNIHGKGSKAPIGPQTDAVR